MINQAELTAQELVIIVQPSNDVLEGALLFTDEMFALDVLKRILLSPIDLRAGARLDVHGASLHVFVTQIIIRLILANIPFTV